MTTPPNLPNEFAQHPTKRLGWQGPSAREMIKFEDISTGAVTYPPEVDHLSAVSQWMLGHNDIYGTCGPTGIANIFVLAYKLIKGENITVTDEAIFKLYRASGNPNFDPTTDADDNGVDNNVMCTALLKVGLDITHEDGTVENVKPLAFATVNPRSLEYLRQATAIFGAVLMGITLDVAQQDQSDTNPPFWFQQPSSVWGGHDVAGGSYTGSATGKDESVVSWAEVVGVADSFLEGGPSGPGQLDEVIVVILPIVAESPTFLTGVDDNVLKAEYKRLTGRDLVLPTPNPPAPPTPTPVPSPVPSPADSDDLTLWNEVRGWVHHYHITTGAENAARNLVEWARAKGLTT
jgi:hypothetical protein